MRNIRLLVFITIVSLVSCGKIDDLQDKVNDNNSFTAIISNDDDTKTSLDGLNVLWSSGDKVDVVYDKTSISSNHATFTLSEGAGTKFGKFTGSTDLSGKDLFVVYPQGCEYSGSYQTIHIPNSYSYNENNIVIPLYGLGNTDTGVTFHHSCSVIEVPLYAEPSSNYSIDYVKIINDAADKISGRFFYLHTSSAYDVSLEPNDSGNYDNIQINCNGLTISEDSDNPTILYFVVRGDIMFKPTFVIQTTNGDFFSKTKSSAINVHAGDKIVMTKVKVENLTNDRQMKIDDGSWVPFDISSIGTISNSISFKSSNSVYSLSDLNAIINEIKSQSSAVDLDMSKAKVLTGTIFPSCSQGICAKLKSIKLPEGIEGIYNSQFAFGSSASLTDIYLPSTLKIISGGPVDGSPCALKFHIDNDYFIAEDGVILSKDKKTLVCFPSVNNTSSYTDYTVPSTVESIGTGAFYYAKYLQKLTIPASVSSISSEAFWDNFLLAEIKFMSSTAPTLSPSTPSWASKPTRAPGYSVTTTKKLTIPSSSDETGYNSAGWKAFTAVGYSYNY